MRPAVACFAEQMELVLQENDHKAGWEKDEEMWLFLKLLEEVAEVALNIREGGSTENLAKECVDVANMAMMIADNTLYRKGSAR